MAGKRKRPPAARRVGIYVRISKDRANEVSTDVQREACAQYATGRSWQVVEIFEDVGRSAFKRNVKRPAFDAMAEAVDAGEIDTVIAYKLDRVARSVRDFANFAAMLDDHDAEFVSVSEQFDTTTPMGRAMVSIASVFAELESAVKSERIGDALAHRRARGAPTNGPRPFGLTSDRSQLVPAEARLIRRAAQQVIAGASLREIVAGWNERGLRTSRGGLWNRRGLAYVLASPTTAGLRDVDGVLVAGTMPAVLDREIWNAVAVVLNDPARKIGAGNDRVHLLTGIATCGRCGTPMAAKSHRAGTRYVCAPRKGHEACNGVSINSAQTDALVAAAVVFRLDSKAVRAAMKAPRSRRDELAEIDDDLEALAGDYGAGRLTRREWSAARAALDARRTAAEEAATRRPTGALRKLAAAKDIAAAWEALDVVTKRQLVRVLVDTATVGPAVPGRQFDPDRVDIEWKA